MLENLPCDRRDRCLAIAGLPDSALPFFESLFGEWGYELLHRKDGPVLFRAGRGSAAAEPSGEAVNLEASFDLPTLWSTIESHFHAAPRRHIRLECDLPAETTFANRCERSRFVSISDAGGRLVYPYELVRGETGRVLFAMSGEVFDTRCEVIYVIPKGEWEQTAGIETGVIFRWPDPQCLELARQCITRLYLDKVAAAISRKDYLTGLKFIDRPKGL